VTPEIVDALACLEKACRVATEPRPFRGLSQKVGNRNDNNQP
jgi:hypothetical protein